MTPAREPQALLCTARHPLRHRRNTKPEDHQTGHSAAEQLSYVD